MYAMRENDRVLHLDDLLEREDDRARHLQMSMEIVQKYAKRDHDCEEREDDCVDRAKNLAYIRTIASQEKTTA
jgi:hypothetical protein